MSSNWLHEMPYTSPPGDEMIDLLTPTVVARHLEEMRLLSETALVGTFTPHRHLREGDPAELAIRMNLTRTPSLLPEALPEVDTYDAGVIFARTLVHEAISPSPEMPSMRAISQPHKLAINAFLVASRLVSVEQLAHRGDAKYYPLNDSLQQFADHLSIAAPFLLLEGDEPLRRGAFDYLGAATLAQTASPDLLQARRRLLNVKRFGFQALRAATQPRPYYS